MMNKSSLNSSNSSLLLTALSKVGSRNSSIQTNGQNIWSEDLLHSICRTVLCTDDEHFQYYKVCLNIYASIENSINIYSNQVSEVSKVLLSVLLSLIMLASVCGNSLVVLTFVLNKHMRSVTNVFILSLAASDLMVAFTCVPLNMANELTPYWTFGRFACKLFAFISQFSVACSSLTLCCIAFDRYYAIVHPLKLKFLQTPRRATLLQIIVLMISMAPSLAYAFFFDSKKVPVCESVDDDNLDEVCMASDTRAKKIFEVWVTPIVLLCIPFIFMSIMYGIICYNLWAQRPIGNRTQRASDNRFRLKRRAVKMLITVVCIFGFCRSPLLLFNAIAETRHLALSKMSNINWRAYLQCLSLSSACWNPIVYAFMNEKFRKAFKTLLRCRRGRVFPVMQRNNNLRISAESRRTTTQLEMPVIPIGSQQTTESRA